MYEQDELLPLSALQHLIFCDRQAALIHVDQVWADNSYTVQGRELHKKVDAMRPEARPGMLVLRSLTIRSLELGLTGKSDVVEFRQVESAANGIRLTGRSGEWMPHPVEYKRGRPKKHQADEVQLCAQAICLEEHFGLGIPGGHIFYGRTRRRQEVLFSQNLRKLTTETSLLLHDLVQNGTIPIRYRESKCERCSLLNVCLPPKRRGYCSASDYLHGEIGSQSTDDLTR